MDELEPKPGLDPTPGHIASIIKVIEAQKVRAILQESFDSTRSANFVKERTGIPVVVCPGSLGHDPKIRGYIELFDAIVGKLSAALG